jgi:hypothetical protein
MILMAIGLLAGFASTVHDNTPTPPTAECRTIRATLEETQISEGCTIPSGVCVAGVIDGNGGLNGTTLFFLNSSAAGPATALARTVSYSGVFTITTDHGTLSLRETGINGPKTGGGRTFASVASVITGTDRFAGATGTLFFTGINVVPLEFRTQMSGELCLTGVRDQ